MAKYIGDSTTAFECDLDNLMWAVAGNTVISGLTVAAQGSPNMTVNVASGSIAWNGASVASAGNATLAIAASDPSNQRIDLVVVSSAGAVSAVTGTPSASPKPPALPANSLLLALVSVAAAGTSVQNSNISSRIISTTAGLAVNGPVRMSNNSLLAVRNVAGSADVGVLTVDGSDYTLLNYEAGKAIKLQQQGGGANMQVSSAGILLSATPVTIGTQKVLTTFAAGNTGTALTLDWANGDIQTCTATGNVTFTLNNPVTGSVYIIKITQDATGSRTYTWPAAVKWPGGTAPTGSGANKTDIINLYWDGTNYWGTSAMNY